MNQDLRANFNIEVVREGLNSISSSSDEMLRLNSSGLVHLDDVFDPMPLDYIQYLQDAGVVTVSFVDRFRRLYKAILSTTDNMSDDDIDAFIALDTETITKWRILAKELLAEVNHV